MSTPTTIREIDAALTAPGERFELETITANGRAVRTWRHAPATLTEILERSREVGGDRALIVLGDERVSHVEHHDRVMRLAAALVEDLGVTPGDRVAIAMRNLPEWSIAFFASAVVGAIAAPLNAFWNGAELAFGLEDCEPRVLIADGERLERLIGHEAALDGVTVVGTRLDDRKTTEPLPEPVIDWSSLLERAPLAQVPSIDPDSLATMLYTSGQRLVGHHVARFPPGRCLGPTTRRRRVAGRSAPIGPPRRAPPATTCPRARSARSG